MSRKTMIGQFYQDKIETLIGHKGRITIGEAVEIMYPDLSSSTIPDPDTEHYEFLASAGI